MKWYYLIFLIVLCSCGNSERNVDENAPVEIDFYAAEKRRIYMDELFDKIEIIPLETNQDCLLQDYPRIAGVTDNHLLLKNDFVGARLIGRRGISSITWVKEDRDRTNILLSEELFVRTKT